MQHIETIELGSSQSSITFSSIPQDYDDLVLVSSVRTDRSNNFANILVRPNNSSANASTVLLLGDGSSASSFSGAALYFGGTGANATASTFSSSSFYISNYTASQNKSISVDSVPESNATAWNGQIIAQLWSDSSAITSLVILVSGGSNLVTGCTFSLYGVTAGGSGTVTTS